MRRNLDSYIGSIWTPLPSWGVPPPRPPSLCTHGSGPLSPGRCERRLPGALDRPRPEALAPALDLVPRGPPSGSRHPNPLPLPSVGIWEPSSPSFPPLSSHPPSPSTPFQAVLGSQPPPRPSRRLSGTKGDPPRTPWLRATPPSRSSPPSPPRALPPCIWSALLHHDICHFIFFPSPRPPPPCRPLWGLFCGQAKTCIGNAFEKLKIFGCPDSKRRKKWMSSQQ